LVVFVKLGLFVILSNDFWHLHTLTTDGYNII